MTMPTSPKSILQVVLESAARGIFLCETTPTRSLASHSWCERFSLHPSPLKPTWGRKRWPGHLTQIRQQRWRGVALALDNLLRMLSRPFHLKDGYLRNSRTSAICSRWWMARSLLGSLSWLCCWTPSHPRTALSEPEHSCTSRIPESSTPRLGRKGVRLNRGEYILPSLEPKDSPHCGEKECYLHRDTVAPAFPAFTALSVAASSAAVVGPRRRQSGERLDLVKRLTAECKGLH